MKPIAAPIVGGMITSTIHVLVLVPIFFAMMKERALKRGTLIAQREDDFDEVIPVKAPHSEVPV